MAGPVIYLSAAQSDLRTHRVAARAILEAEGIRVVEYEMRDATGWSPVRQGMRGRIRECDAVVHLAGICFGAEPNAVPQGAVRRSYAQMEYHLASDLHIPCYSIVLSENFPFDPHPPEDAEAVALQQQHRAFLAQGLSSMDTVHDPGDLQWSLEAMASRIRMGHAKPKKQPRSLTPWLVFIPLVALCALATAYLSRHLASLPADAPVAPAAVSPPKSPVLDERIMAKGRQIVTEVAAAAVTAGLPSEQHDPITKTELAMEDVAGRRGIGTSELQLEMQRFATAIEAMPDAGIMDKAFAAFAAGKHTTAGELASFSSSEEAATEVEQPAPAPADWLWKGHLQFMSGQYAAALRSYQRALATMNRVEKPAEWSETAVITAMAMTQLAQWDEASQLLTDVLILFGTNPASDARAHAYALRAMASVQVARGQARQAEKLLQDACMLLEPREASQEQDPDGNKRELTMTLTLLGEALCIEGKRDGAEDAFHRAVEMQEDIHGADSPQVARVLGSLAAMLAISGRQAQAVGLCERALTINEQRFGPAHPRVARDLMQLASVSSQTQTDGRATDLFRRALDIFTKTLGPKNLLTASAMTGLAATLSDQPNTTEAENLVREAASIDVQALGEEHPASLRDMKVLAQVLKSAGSKDEALGLHHRVLSVCESKYGPDNPETARAVTALARMYAEDGRYTEAEPLDRRALDILDRQFGSDDFRVFLAVRNLARVLQDSGHKEEALEHYRRALDIAKRNLPPDDPGLFVELSNVGSALRSLGRYPDAESVFREALAIQEKSMSPGDPAVAETLSNLAGVLFLSGRHSDAEPVYRRVLEVLAAVSRDAKEPHPNLELARKNYHADLKRMGLTDDEITRRMEKVEAGETVKDITANNPR